MKKVYIILLCFVGNYVFAQNKNISFSGYMEAYYSYDFSNPLNHEKPNFIYNHKRHNEINFNLITAKASYKDKNYRANFALMFGNYAQYNLATEPVWAQFIYEANVGLKISKKTNTWLDAGIFPSHIGFESAIGADCWNLTRSLLAENSPYYETGLKVTHTNKKENFFATILYLNGWQKIQKPNNIQNPSFGLQLNYKPNSKLTLNYSNFIGTDKPDAMKALRHFHNFYVIYEVKKIGLTAGFDLGNDKYNLTNKAYWYAPIVMVKYMPNAKINIALRGEYYNDSKQIIVPTNTQNGFQLIGTSINFDYKIKENILFRNEFKRYQSKDGIFKNNNKENFSITNSLCLKL